MKALTLNKPDAAKRMFAEKALDLETEEEDNLRFNPVGAVNDVTDTRRHNLCAV